MKTVNVILILILAVWLPGCASKPKPRMPLALKPNVAPELVQINSQGIEEYQGRQFDQAKTHFQQVLTGAPTAAEAHYNLGLALFALGDSDQARDHFIEAANLAPGDKVIWDSPALRQFGSPDTNIKKQPKNQGYSNQRPGMGGGPR
ncbi:MAG TPA: tetratricopeptide repeat protein [Nitrospiraceae bacterium]|nr:tetratricopeptide repeat protein [Nitrospiraceae bacterium]